MENFSKKGLFLVALSLVYEAIDNNDDAFFEEYFGSNLLYLIEAKTGVTLSILKKLYSEKKSDTATNNKELIFSAAKTMTIKEIAKTYNLNENSVRYVLQSNKIKYKKANNSDKIKWLIKEIIDFNGKYTLNEISIRTKTNFNTIKKLCLSQKLPYKRSLVN